MAASELVQHLEAHPGHRASVAHVKTLPPKEPIYGGIARPLPDPLASYLARRGIRLYCHQADTLERVRAGRHVIVTTPTASGKTLAFNLPIFERFDAEPQATALYLYPTKALANDQLKAVHEMEKYTGIVANASVYDGDTPPGRRPAIRQRARIVISNPYEVHQILSYHHTWSRFLRSLRFVVIDEAHRYRGVFGSQVAGLLRRVRRIARFYGSEPQFILSTATLANPEEFALRLTGLPCDLVDRDGSPSGTKRFVLYNPYARGDTGRSVHQVTKDLLLACLDHRLQTLCFTTSRKMTELITQWSREALRDRRGRYPEEVAAYRAGYLPEERRGIENHLKSGVLRGVVSTNALELGIDIGSLDAVIISGYPGTVISTWQQAGRAGRRTGESVAILVGFQNPLDQYFMRHPEAFFSRPHEHAIIDCRNPYILSGHLLCAAAELPVDLDRDLPLFGETAGPLLESLEGSKLLRRTLRGWVYAGKGRAADAVQLDGISARTFRVLCNGRLLETMDLGQAYREAHPGAVMLHGGATYVVQQFDLDERTIRVKESDGDLYTQPMKSVEMRVLSERDQHEAGGVGIHFGVVEVTEVYTGYKILKYNQVVGMESLDLPPLRFETDAVWFTVPDGVTEDIANRGMDVAGGLHGIEHAMIGVAPFHLICDRWDIGGLSTRFHPDTEGATVFIYDGCEGGIGLAEKAFVLLPAIVRTARELVAGCTCDDGCPACIYSPKCGNDNQPLDKRATIALLGFLEGALCSLESP